MAGDDRDGVEDLPSSEWSEAQEARTDRLLGVMFVAFDKACDQSDLEVAAPLLGACGNLIDRRDVPKEVRHRRLRMLMDGYSRLAILLPPASGEKAFRHP